MPRKTANDYHKQILTVIGLYAIPILVVMHFLYQRAERLFKVFAENPVSSAGIFAAVLAVIPIVFCSALIVGSIFIWERKDFAKQLLMFGFLGMSFCVLIGPVIETVYKYTQEHGSSKIIDGIWYHFVLLKSNPLMILVSLGGFAACLYPLHLLTNSKLKKYYGG